MKRYIAYILLLLPLLMACEEKKTEPAAQLMQQIRADYEAKHYDECIAAIDSLRHAYPKAVKERKEAHLLFVKASIERAQQILADVDPKLEAAKRDYADYHRRVEAHKATGDATEHELTTDMQKLALRDSLQIVFSTQCKIINYLHKRQKKE